MHFTMGRRKYPLKFFSSKFDNTFKKSNFRINKIVKKFKFKRRSVTPKNPPFVLLTRIENDPKIRQFLQTELISKPNQQSFSSLRRDSELQTSSPEPVKSSKRRLKVKRNDSFNEMPVDIIAGENVSNQSEKINGISVVKSVDIDRSNNNDSLGIKIDQERDSSKKSEVIENVIEKSSQDKLLPDVDEPLSLIAKLTGFQIPPSKVEILPLTSTSAAEPSVYVISNLKSNAVENTFEVSNLVTVPDASKDSVVTQNNGICSVQESCLSLSGFDTGEEVKTVYELMDYISFIMPSWNLHILSDTNTFCICQVSRNKDSVPCATKCIELDDNMNAKVFINHQHCERFDGIYNTADSILELIKEVDAFL